MKYTAEQRLDEMVQTMQNEQASEQKVTQAQERLINAIEAKSRTDNGASLWQKAANWFKESLIASPLRLAGSMGAAASFAIALFVFSASPQTSFASMVSTFKTVSSMFYSATMTNAGEHLMDINVYYRDSGQLRMESYALNHTAEPTFINIMDLKQGKGVMKLGSENETVPFTFKSSAELTGVEEDPLYWRKLILDIDPEQAQPLGTQTFSGTELTGYLIEENNVKTHVWIDPNSQLPVKIKVSQYQENGAVGFEMEASVTYDKSFDDSLFELH